MLRIYLICREFCLIPDRTDDGYDVVLHRLKDYNPQNYFRDTAARSLLMTLGEKYFSFM